MNITTLTIPNFTKEQISEQEKMRQFLKTVFMSGDYLKPQKIRMLREKGFSMEKKKRSDHYRLSYKCSDGRMIIQTISGTPSDKIRTGKKLVSEIIHLIYFPDDVHSIK